MKWNGRDVMNLWLVLENNNCEGISDRTISVWVGCVRGGSENRKDVTMINMDED
jgi:hypothetical protein